MGDNDFGGICTWYILTDSYLEKAIDTVKERFGKLDAREAHLHCCEAMLYR